MNFRQTYRMNGPAVVAEVFEDEIVIIHLDKGTYYSLTQSGALIWKLLHQGATVAEVITTVSASYGIDAESLGEAVQQFIQELSAENLLIADNAATHSNNHAGKKVNNMPFVQGKQTFTLPRLNKYTDMQDLLLLDPIHDVTETGWPHVPAR